MFYNKSTPRMSVSLSRLFLTGIFVALIVSCAQQDSQEEDKPVEEFRDFVQSVENQVGEQTEESWHTLQTTYQERRAAVEAQYDGLSEEAKAEVDKLESRFEKAEKKIESDLAQTDQNLKREMEEFRSFVSNVESNVDNQAVESWNKVESTYQQQSQAIEQDLDQAGETMQAEYQELKSRFEAAREGWKSDTQG